MKRLTCAIVVILLFCCCRATQNSLVENNGEIYDELPDVLNDDSIIRSTISSSRYNIDIIDSIYNDVKKNNDDIKQLHSRMGDILSEKSRAINEFSNFNGKNNSYYDSANNILNDIENNELKAILVDIISKSESNYKNEMEMIIEEVGNIAIEESDLHDYTNTLKVIKTIHFIEEYQKKDKTDQDLLVKIKTDIIGLKKEIMILFED